ncbi:hypothetical protein DICVIV_08503 [Dictyocaulus viviparus]|uniref:Uncharacterized protein n=1 Tax=Dictyocaulus viviparus TaxID=29172 RepID=A0A0D8XNT4_DICVI|nr:hypothetical protein DICVIV_08503 [Dictyocaulus viviparus]
MSNQASIAPHTPDIPAWIIKMAETERCYEKAKQEAAVELERCRAHIRREFEQRRKQRENSYRAEMDALKHKFDKRLKELEQVQTDLAVNKFRRLSMDQSIRSREEREKKIREMNESSKQVFNTERKRFSIGIEQLLEQKQQEHRDEMNKLAMQEAKAMQRLEEIVAIIQEDDRRVRPTSR